ncbi:MAG TPA: type II toxin-antitoxin system HicB family antitoxin [Solirubrobacteraceae bacterium]
MSEYLVIYEQGPTGWGAYCPDLPGLGAAGKTRKEVESLIHEAIELHVESLREHDESVPPPTSAAGTIAVGAA